MSNIQLKKGKTNSTNKYLLQYTYEVPDHPMMEDGDDNWICDGEIETWIDPDLFKDACDEGDDSSVRFPETTIFDGILDNALTWSGVDMSGWENIEFISATALDKRQKSWG